jgi:hypothetical protein
MNEKTRLLPVVELEGMEYVVDVKNRQLVRFKEPGCTIDMHSQRGRRLVSEMQGQEWKSFVVEAAREQSLEV